MGREEGSALVEAIAIMAVTGLLASGTLAAALGFTGRQIVHYAAFRIARAAAVMDVVGPRDRLGLRRILDAACSLLPGYLPASSGLTLRREAARTIHVRVRCHYDFRFFSFKLVDHAWLNAEGGHEG